MKKHHKLFKVEEVREKIKAYCAYRERSQKEVRDKLEDYGLIPEVVDELISELIQQNYLDEERFAKAFARGKFRINKWGKIRIRRELYKHDLSDYLLEKALGEIDLDEYLHTLELLLISKEKSIRESNPYIRKRKLALYLTRKGFEPVHVWELLNADD